MARTYGHSKPTAERLTEMAQAPVNVGPANITPRRQPQRIGGGRGLVYFARTQSTGIPAKTGNTLGSASCLIRTVASDGTVNVTATTETIFNDASTAVGADRDIEFMFSESGIRICTFEDCPADPGGGQEPPA